MAADSSAGTVPGGNEGTADEIARVSQFIERRRNELGLSQRALAAAAGVSLGTIARIARHVGLPRVSTTPKIEEALQWPLGTIQRIREGIDPPNDLPSRQEIVDNPVPPTAINTASQHAQALSIASAVVGVAAVCLEVLGDQNSAAQERALEQLDAQLRRLESLIAASLPDAVSFDDAVAVLREVRQGREAIQHLR